MGCWWEIGAMQSFGFASNGGGLLVLGYKYVNWIDLKYKYCLEIQIQILLGYKYVNWIDLNNQFPWSIHKFCATEWAVLSFGAETIELFEER